MHVWPTGHKLWNGFPKFGTVILELWFIPIVGELRNWMNDSIVFYALFCRALFVNASNTISRVTILFKHLLIHIFVLAYPSSCVTQWPFSPRRYFEKFAILINESSSLYIGLMQSFGDIFFWRNVFDEFIWYMIIVCALESNLRA